MSRAENPTKKQNQGAKVDQTRQSKNRQSKAEIVADIFSNERQLQGMMKVIETMQRLLARQQQQNTAVQEQMDETSKVATATANSMQTIRSSNYATEHHQPKPRRRQGSTY